MNQIQLDSFYFFIFDFSFWRRSNWLNVAVKRIKHHWHIESSSALSSLWMLQYVIQSKWTQINRRPSGSTKPMNSISQSTQPTQKQDGDSHQEPPIAEVTLSLPLFLMQLFRLGAGKKRRKVQSKSLWENIKIRKWRTGTSGDCHHKIDRPRHSAQYREYIFIIFPLDFQIYSAIKRTDRKKEGEKKNKELSTTETNAAVPRAQLWRHDT